MKLLVLEDFKKGPLKADFLNLLMFDIGGGMRSVSLPKGYVSEAVFDDGIGIDASNYGFAKVDQSDMVAIPDCHAAWLEERGEFRIVHMICDIVTTERKVFEQDWPTARKCLSNWNIMLLIRSNTPPDWTMPPIPSDLPKAWVMLTVNSNDLPR